MSEHAPYQPEHVQDLSELSEDLKERPELSTGETAHETKLDAEAIQDKVEAAYEAAPIDDVAEHLSAAEKAASESTSGAVPPPTTYEKQIAAKRELKKVRERLKGPDKVLSKGVHNKVVAVASEVAAKSVSRPSGLLGGGILAFVGSVSYLILAKHLGFTYNSFVMTLLFVVGFALGLLMELAAHALNRTSHSS